MDMVRLRAAAIVVLAIATGACEEGSTQSSPPSSLSTRIVTASPTVSTPPSSIVPIPLELCPVTQPGDRGSPPPAEGSAWLGGNVSGSIGVNLFDIYDLRDHRDRDWLVYKVPWQALAEGDLDVTVIRLDAPGEGIGRVARVHSDAPAPTGGQMFAGEVRVPVGPGCWAVTGRIGQASLTFVFRANT